jgi:hypothetical protein
LTDTTEEFLILVAAKAKSLKRTAGGDVWQCPGSPTEFEDADVRAMIMDGLLEYGTDGGAVLTDRGRAILYIEFENDLTFDFDVGED